MNELISYSVLCFTSLFTLIDPLGTMPVFLDMTGGMNNKERRRIALKSCFAAFLALSLFIVCGKYLFQLFGISIDGFRIVGGIVIFKIGYDMLQAHFTHIKLNANERRQYSNNIVITPLAIPMLCGPGAIASGIALMTDAPGNSGRFILIGIVAFVFVCSYLILCASTWLLKFLGETGNNVMMRLMGLILMVIAVEMFISGMQPILTHIVKQAIAR